MTLFPEILAFVVFAILLCALLVGIVCIDALVTKEIDVLFY